MNSNAFPTKRILQLTLIRRLSLFHGFVALSLSTLLSIFLPTIVHPFPQYKLKVLTLENHSVNPMLDYGLTFSAIWVMEEEYRKVSWKKHCCLLHCDNFKYTIYTEFRKFFMRSYQFTYIPHRMFFPSFPQQMKLKPFFLLCHHHFRFLYTPKNPSLFPTNSDVTTQ